MWYSRSRILLVVVGIYSVYKPIVDHVKNSACNLKLADIDVRVLLVGQFWIVIGWAALVLKIGWAYITKPNAGLSIPKVPG